MQSKVATGHEYKLLNPGVNAPGLLDNWFWRVGLVARRFYCLEASPKDSSLKRFPTLSKKKAIKGYSSLGTLQ